MLIFVIVKCANLNKTFFEDVIPTINVDRHVREKYGNTAKWRKVSEVNFVKGDAYVGMNAKAFKAHLTETFGLHNVSEVKAEGEAKTDAKTESKADAEAEGEDNMQAHVKKLESIIKDYDDKLKKDTALFNLLMRITYPSAKDAQNAKAHAERLRELINHNLERKKTALNLLQGLQVTMTISEILKCVK